MVFQDLTPDQEKALLHMLGRPGHWHDILLDCDNDVMEYIRQQRPQDLQGLSMMGYMMGYFAQAVAEGIKIGRMLERAPVIDALYGAPCEPDAR